MKRIHCYISSLEGGGAEHQMAYLSSFLAAEGYDVTLITLLSRPDKYDVASSVKRVCLDYNLSGSRCFKLYQKIRIFFFFLFLRTDCIISYLVGPNAQVLRPMRLRPWTKVIVSERNLVSWELTQKERYIYGKLYKRANFIVSNSHAMTRYFKETFPVLKPKLQTITNYTDLEKYSVTQLPLGPVLQIGIFARFQRQKNYEKFAEMLSIVRKEDHRAFTVHWYGDMDSRDAKIELSHFESLIKKYQIENLISLHNFVSDVPSTMKSLDIICLPSIFEGFSNSLAEAICCGKPVIAGKISDNSIMIEDGKNGYLFNPLDVYNMKDVFIKMINSSNSNMLVMSKESRSIAERTFSKNQFVHQYSSLIEE